MIGLWTKKKRQDTQVVANRFFSVVRSPDARPPGCSFAALMLAAYYEASFSSFFPFFLFLPDARPSPLPFPLDADRGRAGAQDRLPILRL